MFPGWLQILLVVLLVVVLFGRGKISELMGDVAKGIRSFRDGLKGEDEEPSASTPEIESETLAEDAEEARDETRTS